jgi:arylsulfatase A-like enzyme
MTGRSAVATRMTRFSSSLPRDEIIFPEWLRSEGGYFTGVTGRYFHLDGPHTWNPRNEPLVRMNRELGFITFNDRLDFVETSSPPYRERVAAFLDQKPADKPFFLWVNFTDPHHAWTAKGEQPDPARISIPGYLPDTPNIRRQLAEYYGEIARLDGQVKEILELLSQRGLAENTIVIFAGDNGAAFPHGKGALYDPGLNTPLIIRWPGVIKPDSESRVLVSGEDLAPTLLDAAGIKINARITGTSFLPLLRREPHTPRRHIFAERGPHGNDAVFAGMRSNTFDLSRCVRSDQFKFIYNCTPGIAYSPVDSNSEANSGWKDMIAANEQGTLEHRFQQAYFKSPRPIYELYDLEVDPFELQNLSGRPEFAEVERALRWALIQKMTQDFDYLPLPATDVEAREIR